MSCDLDRSFQKWRFLTHKKYEVEMKNFESIKRLFFFYCGNKKHFANCNVYNLTTFNNLFIN